MFEATTAAANAPVNFVVVAFVVVTFVVVIFVATFVVVVALLGTTLAVRFTADDDVSVGADELAADVCTKVELLCSNAGDFWSRLFLFESGPWATFCFTFRSATLNLG